MGRLKLSIVNNVLVGLIVLVNGYVLIAPFTPQIIFWWQSRDSDRSQALSAKLVQPTSVTPSTTPEAPRQPVENRLIVPSMLLDQPIIEGPTSTTYKNLDKGIWRWPDGSSPDKGGNTIMLGHRFTYTQPKGVLYFLNKVKVGDQLGLQWDGKTYVYKVNVVKIVQPSDVSILEPTTDSRLTIYTCTPLWLPKERLVIVGELVT